IERAEQEEPAREERRPALPPGLVHLERDEQAAEVRDLGARGTQQVGRAPERHVEPEDPVPEIVDRRRQDDDRHAPPRQVKAPRAAEPRDRYGARLLRSATQAPRLEEEHAATQQGDVDIRQLRGEAAREYA